MVSNALTAVNTLVPKWATGKDPTTWKFFMLSGMWEGNTLYTVLLKDSRCLLKIYDFKRTCLCYVLWTFTLIMVCFYIHLVGSGPCNIFASLPTSKVILPTSTTAKLILTAQISELRCTALCFPNYHNDHTKHKYRSHWISEDKERQNVQYNSLTSAST